jgi:hypothetical protein
MVDTSLLVHFTFKLIYQNSEFVYYVKYDPMSICIFCHSINGENIHYGTPINPCAEDRVPGGSSSGSAVAVGAKLVDFSLGGTFFHSISYFQHQLII